MTRTQERPDPYELVFGAESIDERLFPPIAEEADARRLPLDDPERFVFLSSVGKLLQAIAGTAPDEAGAGPPAQAAPGGPTSDEEASRGEAEASREAIRHYGRVLFHAFHHWRARKPTETLPEEKVRWLLDEVTTVGDWSLRPPAPAGYLRLPRNLVWAAPAANQRPEPADGFFWMLEEPDGEPARLHVLLALGVRPDRPGFSIVTTTGVLDDEPHWANARGRPEGGDFETTLPGGELDGLYSIETAAELLKLVSRAFWELDPASG
ncbi:MAG: hypothetical protein ACOCVZ_05485 [Gemmatimonadota bacterium]